MNKRHYEPMWQHTYRIFVNGVVDYLTTNYRRFCREVERRAGQAITITGPR